MKHAAPICTLLAAALTAAAGVGFAAPSAPPPRRPLPADLLEPAHAALRALQFAKAIQLLTDMHGDADAQHLLGLMYLNGVGVPPDPARARALFKSAAEHGQGAAAFVLAGEMARDANTAPDAVHELLQRAARLGYVRAVDFVKTGKPIWERETAGATDPALFIAWSIDCARNDDAAELKRLGPKSAQVRDDFGRSALQHAAAAGSMAAAATLLDLGADIRTSDAQGVTALMLAAEFAGPDVTSLLLERGADPKAVDAENRTAAFYAARANHVATLRVLARAGVALDARDARGYNALDAALAVQSDGAATELRANGLRAEVTVPSPGRQTGIIDAAHPGDIYRGWSPLALALTRNDTARARQLLDAGADVSARTPQGDTALQVAADAHALTSIPVLLTHGANPIAAGHSEHGVLWLATVRADLPLVQALLAAGVRPDAHAATEEPPLLAATRAMHAAVATALLDAGADVRVVDAQGRTALMIAAASTQRVLLEVLLTHHCDVDARDRRGRTALWHAAAAGSVEEVALLLANGAKVSATDSTGLGPLQAAASQANTRVLDALISGRAALNGRGSSGDSALMIAAAGGRTDAVRALLTHTPALDLQNVAGDTALISASRAGHSEVCRLLLEAGANRALRNHAGVAAADVAASRGFTTLAAIIGGVS
jgi:ankyrin repeat protein